jgi:chromosome segregation ATPase
MAVIAMAAMVLAAAAYSYQQHNVAQQLQEQNTHMMDSLKATSEHVDQLTAKIYEMNTPKAPVTQESHAVAPREATPRAAAARQTAQHAKSKTSAQTRRARTVVRRDDPRWKQFQAQIDEQGRVINSTRDDIASNRNDIASTRQDLASTRQDLSAAKNELGDSIARTHSELVVLQRKGERNYYEFNIDKTKNYKQLGPIGIRLKKANVKGGYADLQLRIDDREITKKHVNIYEPSMFYTSDSDQPAQVVINSVSKNHIRGYVSEPKYRPAQLSAASQEPGRQKLSLPNQ